jgi:hypothetical protein
MKLKVDNVIENPDGTATVNFELDDEMEMFIANFYKVDIEELTAEQVQEFVLKAVNGLVEQKQKDLQQP